MHLLILVGVAVLLYLLHRSIRSTQDTGGVEDQLPIKGYELRENGELLNLVVGLATLSVGLLLLVRITFGGILLLLGGSLF